VCGDAPSDSFGDMVELVLLYSVAVLLGAMVFLAAVVAPTVFRALPPDAAGAFLRTLFPAYYAFIIVSSIVASTAAVAAGRYAIGATFGLVVASTAYVRQVLVPKINADRDAAAAGDRNAAKRFDA